MSGNDGLYPVSNTTLQNRRADIVFVHGLGGSSHSTWRHGREGSSDHFFWPEELGNDLSDYGIWTVGYPAGFTKLGTPGMIIELRAGNLALKMTNADLGFRPLIFVCHSMGGLVIKSLVADSQSNADADRKRIAEMVRGIIFCATPHRGSYFADAASILSQFFLGTQTHVEEMRANQEQLDLLHERFIEWQRKTRVPIESYAENIGLFRKNLIGRPIPLGPVVPRASANPGIAGFTVKDVDDDHLTLVKPSHRKHDVYAGVLRFIRMVVQPNPIPADLEPTKLVPIPIIPPLSLYFSKRPMFPSMHFSIANESKKTIQITSIRSIIAAKVKDNHTSFEYLTGVRTDLKININKYNEGAEVELLGDRVILLDPGEIEGFSLKIEITNAVALLDIDIDYIEVGTKGIHTWSPDQLILAHAPVERLAAEGSFVIIERTQGMDILGKIIDFHPWLNQPYQDCLAWKYAFRRGAGCFLIGNEENLWPALSELLKKQTETGPIWASIAETALRRSMPTKILEALKSQITSAPIASKLSGSDEEVYAVTISRVLKQLAK